MRKAAARLAPQAPEDEAASERLRKEAEEEQAAIRAICDVQGLEIHEINPDGHCLFAAVADQLAILSVLPVQRATYHTTRHATADYLEAHPDDFLPFLVSMEEDGAGASDAGLMTLQDFQKYCATIRDTGAWGGEPEILAMARAFDVQIHVVQWGTPSVVVHSPNSSGTSTATGGTVRVSYHRRMYGLGEASINLHLRDVRLTVVTALQFIATEK
ncbi:hypothetical protein JB92DRAFT_2815421 [Gautieria morchelliformis]|nr:hypothetical protein JB92DRAFT_2815421 [Gautieria morchelliformis]